MKPEARRAMTASLPTLVLHFRALLGRAARLSAFRACRARAAPARGPQPRAVAAGRRSCLARTIPGAHRRILAGLDHMAPLSRAEEIAASSCNSSGPCAARQPRTAAERAA